MMLIVARETSLGNMKLLLRAVELDPKGPFFYRQGQGSVLSLVWCGKM